MILCSRLWFDCAGRLDDTVDRGGVAAAVGPPEPDRVAILTELDDPPAGLETLRATLLAEHVAGAQEARCELTIDIGRLSRFAGCNCGNVAVRQLRVSNYDLRVG